MSVRTISPHNTLASITRHDDDARSVDLGAKAAKVVELAGLASRDSFESAKSPLPTLDWRTAPPGPGAKSVLGSGPPPGAPGRRPASELNPFDARTVPTSKDKAKSGIQAEVDGKGATLALGDDRDARLASIKSEVEGQVGNDAGPEDAWGDVGLDGNKIVDAMMKGAATGAMGGAAAAAATGGAATPLILRTAATNALMSGAAELVGQLAPVVREAVTKALADAAQPAPPPPSGSPPAGSTPPGGVPPAPAEGKAGGEASDDAPAAKDEADGGTAESNLDPTHHGSGRSYEAMRQAYLGHADGTPFGTRATTAEGGPATRRNTNPGRDRGGADGPQEATQTPSVGDLTLVADPYRTARLDARAAQLLEMGRVTGRVIFVDPNADDDKGNGGVKPKGNGLVR